MSLMGKLLEKVVEDLRLRFEKMVGCLFLGVPPVKKRLSFLLLNGTVSRKNHRINVLSTKVDFLPSMLCFRLVSGFSNQAFRGYSDTKSLMLCRTDVM